MQGCIVESQFGQGFAKRLIVVALDWKQPGKNPWLDFLESGQRLNGRSRGQRNGIANPGRFNFLDARNDKTHLARAELIGGFAFGGKDAHIIGLKGTPGGHYLNFGSSFDGT